MKTLGRAKSCIHSTKSAPAQKILPLPERTATLRVGLGWDRVSPISTIHAPIVIVVLKPIQQKRQAGLHLPGHRIHRLWSVQQNQQDMWGRIRGLDLSRELEGELERLAHVELALMGVVGTIRVLAAKHVKVCVVPNGS